MEKTVEPAEAAAPEPSAAFPPWRVLVAALAIALWLVSVFEHRLGSDIFSAIFGYGKKNWGPAGMTGEAAEKIGFHRMEMFLLGIAFAMAATVFFVTAVRVARMKGAARSLPELATRWAIWFLCALAANRFTICLQSEDVHFAQYGFVAFCAAIVTGNPRIAFLTATFMGFLDESNQWWRMYYHDWDNHEDWNDMVANACGAAAGALPFTSFARIRLYGEGKEDETGEPANRKVVIGGLAAVALISFFLVRFTYLGHYPEWPFWTELANGKPFHVLTLREGLPALLAISCFFYFLVDERRRTLPFCAVLAALVAVHVAVSPPRSDRPQALHEDVPTAMIPHARGPVTIDGELSPDEWAGAARLPLRCYAPDAEPDWHEKQWYTFGDELESTALVQWDERALYVAFECKTKDVWARDLGRDDPRIPGNPVVELFLDMDAAERSYYELDVSPGNAVQDLFVYWPEAPSWITDPQNVNFVGLNRWDCHGLRTAIKVQGGKLDLVPADVEAPKRALPEASGYTVEMEIPWQDVRGRFANDTTVPSPGARLRANLYAIQFHRPAHEALPDGKRAAETYLAWAPTKAPLDFHRPQFFGVFELEGKK